MLKIYHNPRCSKSRATLALIEKSGVDHVVVRYLDNPPSSETLRLICQKLKVDVSAIIRTAEPVYQTLNEVDDWFVALSENPSLIQRPIIENEHMAVIGRPPENVLMLLR
jgi:arsenate reductase (glutaredoxin)